MLNYRETEILNNLIKGKRYTFKLISEKYSVSDRAARYYINNIDSILRLLDYKITEKDKNSISLDNVRISKICLTFWKIFINYLLKIE